MTGKTWKEIRMDKRRFWKVHIQAWQRSGFSQNEYCRRNNLKTSQFTYWKTKFKQEDPTPVSFVPVPVSPTPMETDSSESGDSGVSVLLGATKIKIENNFNPSCLVKIVSALENRS